MRIAARPASGQYTFGLKRAEIFSAQINGLSLLLLAGWLAYEAIGRLIHPPQVTGWMVIVTGLLGLAVNVVAAWAISKANRSSLNIEGAYQHVLMDTLASAAAAAAGAIIVFTGFQRADSIATLLVVALMVKGGWALVRDSARVLLNAAPAGMNTEQMARQLLSTPEVLELHDLHVWSIGSEQPALSAHVMVERGADCHRVRRELESALSSRYGITHTTLQVDHFDEALFHDGHQSDAIDAHCVGAHGPSRRREPGPEARSS
jgi:cobalt-zinc-cadmium efflux system protein